MRKTLAALLLAAAAGHAAEVAPGQSFSVDPNALPPPGATPSAGNPPEIVARPQGAGLLVPSGYRATLFAEGLSHARNLLVAPDGTVIVAEQHADKLTLLSDTNGDGRADRRATIDGFSQPFGLALAGDELWVADTKAVWRLHWPDGARRVQVTARGALGDAHGHSTRNLALAPDRSRFFVAIGSAHNVAEEAPPRATIQEFAIDGSGQRTLAAGLRNPVGLAIRPGTDELWTVVNERDGLGDELVPDYLTRVHDGGFYGWPYAYLGGHPQPGLAAQAPAKVKATLMPDLLFRSHSAPLGLAFWHGDAFVALHGSWNRSDPVGYLVARVPFKDGRPLGWYEAFATGFALPAGKGQARVWGRPVGLAVGPDDALYVADDSGQTVWRIVRE
ncbi:MAG: PQQ-dependent sugar dehydrogenase [Solirubrobacterales bacterium]